MIEQENDYASVDDIINEAASILDYNNPIGSLDEIKEDLDEIPYLETDFTGLDQLESLLLYCEDIVNEIPNACNHSLFHNLYVDFKRKVDDFEEFFQKYEENSYKILTSKRCIEYSRKVNDKIIKLEQDLDL